MNEKIELFIDYREYHLVEHFKDLHNVTIKTLEVGDIAFYYKDKPIILIERKTINDLAASIMDGRNREQKIRLMNCGIVLSNIMYLIEGNVNQIYHKKMTTKTIVGSIINTMFRDNIKVYRTNNIKETIGFIERIYHKLHKHPEKIISTISQESSINKHMDQSVLYANTIKSKKKDNLTPEVCNIIQLSQIPGVSTMISKTILDSVGGSIYHLCKKYHELEVEENGLEKCEKLVEDIKIKSSSNKGRKIGYKVSSRIYHYLTNQ
tara:strand:+ start:695 stop:1486 length:792 start_codon:yes stop_codon:yes gene_type:complete